MWSSRDLFEAALGFAHAFTLCVLRIPVSYKCLRGPRSQGPFVDPHLRIMGAPNSLVLGLLRIHNHLRPFVMVCTYFFGTGGSPTLEATHDCGSLTPCLETMSLTVKIWVKFTMIDRQWTCESSQPHLGDSRSWSKLCLGLTSHELPTTI